jgi:antitoxin PrlF
MQISTSKLTKKYQATIPGAVRDFLHLTSGDVLAFDINGHDVRIRKARPIDLAFTHAIEGTLSEWASEADEEAYSDL